MCAARHSLGVVGLFGLSLLAAGAALAQTNDEVISGTQFNFSTPGARSLGMGGAFLAVADDATAAFTNPAGLTQLGRSEASIEARSWGFTSRFTERGHSPEAELTGIGTDVVGGLEAGEIDQRTEGLSFLSAVWVRQRFSFAVYGHQLADFRAAVDSQGAYVGRRENPSRLAPARSQLELGISSFGLATGYRLSERWSLGLGVARSNFDLESLTRRYARAERTGDPVADSLTGQFFGPADFREANVANFQQQEGNDQDWSWTFGALWRPGSQWSVGAVARHGPAFDFTATFTDGPASPDPGVVDPELSGAARFRVPDAYGLGVGWRPVETIVVSCDWMRVRYSQMTSELRNVLRAVAGDRRAFHASDADELHLGGELQWLEVRWPVSLRAGLFYDPEHRIRYTGGNETLRARFRPGEDETHYALGAGLVVGRAQFDLAADLAKSTETVSLSMVARF
jgi:long-subunit fatty acid transport protein